MSVLEEQHTLSVEAVAKVLGISRPSAYAAVHRGEIPSIKIGNRLLVPTARLRALLEGTPVESDEETP